MPDPITRLYLLTPVLDDPAAFGPSLDAALAAGDVACVLFRLKADDSTAKAALKTLIARVQAQDVAALLAGDDTRLMGHLGADGLHLPYVSDDLVEAVRSLKPARIVGFGGLGSRDDAMTAGESGVDYVMFGDRDGAVDGAVTPWEDRLERVAWWAEIFQLPCVAVAHAPEEVEALAACGADFVALGPWMWGPPDAVAAAVSAAMVGLARGAETFLAHAGEQA